MDAYFVIIHLPDRPTAEIVVLQGDDETAALAEAKALAADWPSFARVEVYQRTRQVAVIEGRSLLAA